MVSTELAIGAFERSNASLWTVRTLNPSTVFCFYKYFFQSLHALRIEIMQIIISKGVIKTHFYIDACSSGNWAKKLAKYDTKFTKWMVEMDCAALPNKSAISNEDDCEEGEEMGSRFIFHQFKKNGNKLPKPGWGYTGCHAKLTGRAKKKPGDKFKYYKFDERLTDWAQFKIKYSMEALLTDEEIMKD